MQNLIPRQIDSEISGHAMHIHEGNIHNPPAADRLPGIRKPALFDVPPKKDMQVRNTVFCELQNRNKRQTSPELPRE